jgi:hypothetical protein
MAGGPILPSSIYVGGASGNLSPTFYVSGAASGGGAVANSYIEGVGCVASVNALAADPVAVLQFNLPEVIPTGVLKCRVLAWANASAGIAKVTLSDGQTAAGSNIAGTTLTADTQISQTWATADIIVENKVTLATAPTANSILTVTAAYNRTGWTLAQSSVWQFSLVWE